MLQTRHRVLLPTAGGHTARCRESAATWPHAWVHGVRTTPSHGHREGNPLRTETQGQADMEAPRASVVIRRQMWHAAHPAETTRTATRGVAGGGGSSASPLSPPRCRPRLACMRTACHIHVYKEPRKRSTNGADTVGAPGSAWQRAWQRQQRGRGAATQQRGGGGALRAVPVVVAGSAMHSGRPLNAADGTGDRV